MYTLRSIARRGGLIGTAAALLMAAIIPAAPAFADALNPLTERSLTLSSGSPGWNFKDASGNGTYAPPNSGPNGQKTGNTFSFRVSSNAALKGMTFQYCTTPAGNCKGPGDNLCKTGTTAGSDCVRKTNAESLAGNDKKSDLEIVTGTGLGEIGSSTFTSKFDAAKGQPKNFSSGTYDPDTVHPNMPALDGSEGNFIMLHKATVGANWAPVAGWTMAASIRQTKGGNGTTATEGDGTSNAKNNFITLTNSTNSTAFAPGDYVKVIFFATNNTYITNPGSKEFFVKINTYNSDTTLNDTTLVDGGVTVANVMNRSIEIQTKVLETMDFSVGTVDPNTLVSNGSAGSQYQLATGRNQHGPCDPVVQGMTSNTTTPNVLQLGDPDGEFSLRTDTTYSTHSYWRLSSNSSGGATVYYSGVTLSNTVGDQIKAIGKTAASPSQGGEQFGLALDNATTGNRDVSYAKERDSNYVFQNGADNDVTGIDATTTAAVGSNLSWHSPRLSPLSPDSNYAAGTGVINTKDSHYGAASTTQFAFDPESNVIPTPFATGTQVLDCVTGKMRYIANIAATTPAGIYTTKINYIAAPQY